MPTVTVSAGYRIVIPKAIRAALAIEPGRKMHVTLLDGCIGLVPVEPVTALRGFLPGLRASVPRERDRA